jgi:hypothetical protein
VIHTRTFATEEAKTESPELTENEKKLTEEMEKLVKDVEGLTEKNKELDVSKLEMNQVMNFLINVTTSYSFRTNTNDRWLRVKTCVNVSQSK